MALQNNNQSSKLTKEKVERSDYMTLKFLFIA